jgi:hypothetical protein
LIKYDINSTIAARYTAGQRLSFSPEISADTNKQSYAAPLFKRQNNSKTTRLSRSKDFTVKNMLL